MAVNLAEKYSKKIQTIYIRESLAAGKLSADYDFAGARTVKVYTPQTVPMEDYNRTVGANRYGTPAEMQDIVQELTLSQDKSFSMVIDKGNNVDQMGVKKAGQMLALQIAERAIPLLDKYVLDILANKAGTIYGNVTAISKTNVVERILDGATVLNDAEAPSDGRILFVPAATYNDIKISSEFIAIEKVGEKALSKGVVGTLDNMQVVMIPAGRWPANVNFIIAHKNAATAPVKLNDTKLHTDPPGISGNLLEGRQYYDCFVLGAKANAIYVDVFTGVGGATITTAPTINTSTGELSESGAGAVYYYTVDGSDPRYSTKTITGQPSSPEVGTVIKAYAKVPKTFASAVSTATVLDP